MGRQRLPPLRRLSAAELARSAQAASGKAIEPIVGCPRRSMFRRQPHERRPQIILFAALLAAVACVPLSAWSQAPSDGGEWHDFQGTWTAVGKRQAIPLGGERRASIVDF